MTNTKTRHIPTGYELIIESPIDNILVYGRTTERGTFVAMGFHGTASKADWHFQFRTELQRNDHVAKYIDGRKARVAMMAEIKAKRMAAHSLVLGDILRATWGYDQTNVDYYEVVRVVGPRQVEIREIASATVSDDGHWTGKCSPVAGQYKGPVTRHTVGADNYVKVSECARAGKVEKNDVSSWTAYA